MSMANRNQFRMIFNGTVLHTETRQFYQSKGAKWFRALLSGEPYQLGYTSHRSVIRLMSEGQIREAVVFGNMENLLVPGDEVTVTAKRRNGRLVATGIFSHTLDEDVYVEPNIPASLLRGLILLLILLLVALLVAVDQMAEQNLLLQAVAAIAIGWYLVKHVLCRR